MTLTQHYDLNGFITRQENRDGSFIDFAYGENNLLSTVTGSNGNSLNFLYGDNATISEVEVQDGVLNYDFDSLGNLSNFNKLGEAARTYYYENPNFYYVLSGIIGGDGLSRPLNSDYYTEANILAIPLAGLVQFCRSFPRQCVNGALKATSLASSMYDAWLGSKLLAKYWGNENSDEKQRYYHYTSYDSWISINLDKRIRQSGAGKIHITTIAMDSQTVENILFIGNESHKGRGEYLLDFTLDCGIENSLEPDPTFSGGYIYKDGHLEFKKEIEKIFYNGINPFGGYVE